MPQPRRVDRLADELVAIYQRTADELRAELDSIAGVRSRFRQRERLERLIKQTEVLLDTVDEQAAAWLRVTFPKAYKLGATAQARRLEASAAMTSPHMAATAVLAEDTYNDLLTATRFMRKSQKGLIRVAAKHATGRAVAGGKTAVQAGRTLAEDLRRQGLAGIRYANGSLHALDEYAEMVVRTKSAVAYNVGSVNVARAEGVEMMECFDGADCGLESHQDADKANGMIVPIEVAETYTLAHPGCRRSWSARPDLTRKDADKAVPSTTPEQRADQAAYEAFQRQRQSTRVARTARARSRSARTARA